MNPTTSRAPIPEAADVSQVMAQRLSAFLALLLRVLDSPVDVRLVRTFAATVVNLVRQRNPAISLLLAELGELLLEGARAPAGVKRVRRLLPSPNGQPEEIDTSLADQASAAIARVEARGAVAFGVLYGSGVEKQAAKQLEGLTKIRSALARRWPRASGGPPPPIPTIVPGFGWVAVVVTGLTGRLTVTRRHWFSPTAPDAQRPSEAERDTGLPFLLLWAHRVIWLVDRGLGSAAFLGEALARAR